MGSSADGKEPSAGRCFHKHPIWRDREVHDNLRLLARLLRDVLELVPQPMMHKQRSGQACSASRRSRWVRMSLCVRVWCYLGLSCVVFGSSERQGMFTNEANVAGHVNVRDLSGWFKRASRAFRSSPMASQQWHCGGRRKACATEWRGRGTIVAEERRLTAS